MLISNSFDAPSPTTTLAVVFSHALNHPHFRFWYSHPHSVATIISVGTVSKAFSRSTNPRAILQGCPIYGKIRFLRIFIAKKTIYGRIYGLASTPPLQFRDRGILRKKTRFLDESADIYIFVLSSATAPPPPPDFRLAVFRARRVNLFGCAE